jgi:pyruvate dehydrogenase E2 component (dihydrolipoamide acetyltransferase)
LGENIDSGDVLSILVSEGDTIAKEQDLIEIETDKATMPVPSPQAGKVVKVLVSEGDTIAVGAAILEIDPVETAVAAPAKAPAPTPAPAAPKVKTPPAPAAEAASPEAPPPMDVPIVVEPQPDNAAKGKTAPKSKPEAEATGDGHSASAAGPAVRRLARELGVDLRRVRPSSSSGRITEDDVRAHVRTSNEKAASAAPPGVTPPGKLDTDDFGAVRREKMSRLRQTIARNMLESYTTIPQLTNFDDVDVTELERIRKDSKDDYAAQGIKLTSMPFLIKAVASALRHHPVVNASIDAETNETIYKEYVNIGVAVDTDKGLIVPVLRDADRKNIPQIARELARIADAARSGSFKVEDLRGGTFTISNLGAIGGTYSTPIINPPEVAILLAGRSRLMPHYVGDKLQPRLMLPLSLTYDHRIVDGAAAARFLNELKGFLANPGRLLLAP